MPIMNIILNLKLRNDVKMETLKQKTSNMEFFVNKPFEASTI